MTLNSMEPLALDIETIPDETKEKYLAEPEPAKNIKDPDKIKEDIERKRAGMVSKMALSPFTGRICSFSIYGKDKENRFSNTIDKICDAEEARVLGSLFALLTLGLAKYRIITWNGYRFDFPYIYKRAMSLSLPLPSGCPALNYWGKRYSRFPHCDLMQELAGWSKEENETLDMMGQIFLGAGKSERDYKYYVDLIKSGKSKKIGADNLCDAKITYELYLRFAPYLFGKDE